MLALLSRSKLGVISISHGVRSLKIASLVGTAGGEEVVVVGMEEEDSRAGGGDGGVVDYRLEEGMLGWWITGLVEGDGGGFQKGWLAGG